jgi:hypothetical protein
LDTGQGADMAVISCGPAMNSPDEGRYPLPLRLTRDPI